MELLKEFVTTTLETYQNSGLEGVLTGWSNAWGLWLYLLLFLIIFCETGLVVTPFLPGDSLLFLVGSLLAQAGSQFSLPVMLLVLIAAAVIGDAVNYHFGYRVGPAVFRSEQSRLFNKAHLLRAQQFYEKYGGKTIILARFIPIIRTFAPFVAGIGKMTYRRFFIYNVIGAAAWVLICVFAGYFFGNLQWVKQHFEAVVVAIIVISIMPMVIEYLLARRRPAVDVGLAVGQGLVQQEAVEQIDPPGPPPSGVTEPPAMVRSDTLPSRSEAMPGSGTGQN